MKFKWIAKYLLYTFSMLFFQHTAFSQLYINEFMASNTGVVVDPDYDETSDWIELYNAGSETLDIGGWYLSDNFNTKDKWSFPIGVAIKPGAYLVIWADGVNTGLHTNFKLSSDGEDIILSNEQGETIDSIAYPLQEPNISMGRKSDGSNEWVFYTESSPGASNNTYAYDGIVKNKPLFYPLGGIFGSSVDVTLKNTFGGNIYYTMDGSEPDKSSAIYTQPISIENTTVLRARILRGNEIPGEVITHTYFIDTEGEIGKLPVVALSVNPDDFWDPEVGIYVQNYKPEREVPINIELFENDGSDRAAFNEKAGTKVNGLWSWQLPQKMLGIYFRKEYGKGKLEYPLFFDRSRNNFDSFALRASGSDWAYTMFRDGLAQTLTAENMDVDYQGFRACVVFVNGEYLGIHNIRSKIDEDFIRQNHVVDDRGVDMVEWTDDGLYAESGDVEQFMDLENLLDKDLSEQSNFDAVADIVDIENFTDYVVAEIYARNTSIGHNVMAWKPEFGGHWKWILMDLDRGFFGPDGYLINYYEGRDEMPLGRLLQNDGYRKYFGRRLSDHLMTTYNPARVSAVVDQFAANIENEMPKHIGRWEGTSSNYGDPISSMNYWYNELDDLKNFANIRPSYLLQDLERYGFEAALPLSVSAYPEGAGVVYLNGLLSRIDNTVGAYPQNEEVSLLAEANAGSQFLGWAQENAVQIIGHESIWKYNDKGELPSSDWMTTAFDDSAWDEGEAELGYGDGDEATEVSYGGDSGDKYITTYFRKNFTIESSNSIQKLSLTLKCDDGAVIYLNGTEVIRQNMPTGEISNSTEAEDAVGGSNEEAFSLYSVDAALLIEGDNLIAVEIHQASPNSSDISFDLGLDGVGVDMNNLITDEAELTFTHTSNGGYVAVFEDEGSCVLPGLIDDELVLDVSCSPYLVPQNVTVSKSGKLIVPAGIELQFSDGISLTINGRINVYGEENNPVLFTSNKNEKLQQWGIVNFVNADTSSINNLIVEDASRGIDPIKQLAAISVFNSVLKLNGLIIENVYANPIAARYSDITLLNSSLHSKITGDLINVKYGKALIDNCEFIGNDMPDTDAIDYDDVEGGIIRNCIIRDFHGFNSDGIDIGERAQNILIENVTVYNITDKGVSVGQQSSANIRNSIFVNCNLGAGIKDSCKVIIDHCTYYGNGTPVSCYEKNAGDAGGNAWVSNSILSNSYENSFYFDDKSTLSLQYSLSDNDALSGGNNNLFDNPQFVNPNIFDFSLEGSSPCLKSAVNGGDIGASLNLNIDFNSVLIRIIAYNSSLDLDELEYIVIGNPGADVIDLSGYKVTKGFTFEFPDGVTLEPGRDLYISNNASSDFWFGKGLDVFQWESGRLDDSGEALQLETPAGIVVDRVRYNENSFWPDTHEGEGIELISLDVDNHFGHNWKVADYHELVSVESVVDNPNIKLYPNPVKNVLTIEGDRLSGQTCKIYDVNGRLHFEKQLDENNTQIEVSGLDNGVYFIEIEHTVKRFVVLN